MTVNIICLKGYEAANETIRKVGKIEEIQNNLGTFIEITDEGNATTNFIKRHIKKIEIEIETPQTESEDEPQ